MFVSRSNPYSQICGSADAEARVGQQTVDSQAKKTGFVMAKVEQYSTVQYSTSVATIPA